MALGPQLHPEKVYRIPGYHVFGERGGVMLHFDDSSSDESGLDWLIHLHGRLGYSWAVRDNGQLVELTDYSQRTYHAGPCLTPNANSFFYGVAALTNEKTPVTPAQFDRIVGVTAELWRYHRARWGEPTTVNLIKRIVGHDRQAIYTSAHTANTKLWGKLGRKIDPTGLPNGPVILSVPAVREAVRALLLAA